MLQITASVFAARKGSTNAVSATGFTSMSDSLMACHPRMLEPSNPSPFSNTSSVNSRAGIEKCCHRPGKSMNLRSTTSTFCVAMNETISLGVLPMLMLFLLVY